MLNQRQLRDMEYVKEMTEEYKCKFTGEIKEKCEWMKEFENYIEFEETPTPQQLVIESQAYADHLIKIGELILN